MEKKMEQNISDCTEWDNSSIFSSIKDPLINETIIKCKNKIKSLSSESVYFENVLNNLEALKLEAIPKAQSLLGERHDLYIELSNIMTFCSCLTSVNAKDEDAKKIMSTVNNIFTDLFKLTTPIDIYIKKIDADTLEKLLDHEVIQYMDFKLSNARKMNDFMLNSSEEQLVRGLSTDGLHAWGKLYSTLAGNLEVDVAGETMGLAKASGLLRQGDRIKREAAWRGIQQAWRTHQETVCAILNSLNGWRIEDNTARSSTSELHYLDKSCHQSHITRKTLTALMETTFENRSVGHRALRGMAKSNGLSKLGPWDILSPAPEKSGEGKLYGFKEAIDIIAEAFSTLTPAMGDFAQLMYKNNWIDAKETAYRSPGAYCTGFTKYREPRVFMTYDGSMGNVITLAHELGHAYHNWVMRDMHVIKTHYAMTTAETASIFGETLVRDYLYDHSKNDHDKFQIAWQDAESAAAMLCNIPARFEFEKQLIEQRKERSLSVNELNSTMHDAWKLWYGDSLTEMNDMMWATKLHFSISGLGFYNYPYLFGYLFSLGIYAQKDLHGDNFNDLYTKILRDTGSMTAVELINKHLSKSIEEKSFWQGSLDLVEKSVQRFESLID
jgi:oligoendopeptidase F